MKTLEITYEIRGFDRVLFIEKPSWNNCEFTMNGEDIATLRIWEDGIDNVAQIDRAKIIIKQRVKTFILALEYRLQLPLTSIVKKINYPTIMKMDGTIHITENFGIDDEPSNRVLPVKPPEEMPSLPVECEPWILTLAEAHIFEQYVEEQFKRQYLIIEELWAEFAHEFDKETQDIKPKLKLIRNFLSHAICDDKNIIELVSNDLPTSILDDGRVKFLRNDIDHRNFIARFEIKSREISHALVEKKIRQIEHRQIMSPKL